MRRASPAWLGSDLRKDASLEAQLDADARAGALRGLGRRRGDVGGRTFAAAIERVGVQAEPRAERVDAAQGDLLGLGRRRIIERGEVRAFRGVGQAQIE